MTDKTDIPELRRFNFEIWPHEAYISEQYDGDYVLFADANQQLEAANREIAALKSKDISCTLGVGDGSGRLFVHGDYESIKATQKIIIERDALKGDQVPVAWLNDAHLARGHIEGEAGEEDAGPGMIPVYREKYLPPQKPVISKEKLCDWLEDNFDIDDIQRDAFAACFGHCCDCIVQSHSPAPVGEIVAWAGANREKGITREVDFRFLRFDVLPGTKLYAVEPAATAAKSDLLTRAQALAVETRALACRIKAGE
ncbi:hypothetical protein [Rahnella sp. PAMC 25559]|uniref:hypothetical protein n=1 Tax=Rahnella sp. PAMC 25559 TaxID=3423225 RepID=UPI003D66DDCB